MYKLSKLSGKEELDQPLDGSYRVTLDIHVDASKNSTLDSLQKTISTLGEVDNLTIEKYSNYTYLNIGDEVELTSAIQCQKTVYLDTNQNYVISDKLMSEDVSPVEIVNFSLDRGTVAEINKKAINGRVEILFTGTSVDIGNERKAYLGILELPCDSIQKYQE